MAIVTIKATLPKALVKAFMQHLRDFDVQHYHDSHYHVMVLAPEMTMAETEAALDVEPPFALRAVHRTQ